MEDHDRPPLVARTVCHGCRTASHVMQADDDDIQRLRNLIIPGDGTVMRELSPGVMVTQTCTLCGDSDTPGWLPGFVVPM